MNFYSSVMAEKFALHSYEEITTYILFKEKTFLLNCNTISQCITVFLNITFQKYIFSLVLE